MLNIPESGLKKIIAPSLSAPHVSHGFYTRCGGTSTGLYEGLNCGSGSKDSMLAVHENRMLVAQDLSCRRDTPLITPYQVHENVAVTVSGHWAGEPEKADALVSNTPGVIIGILTADCTPILFYDEQAKVIAAAHAGWKGAKRGIIQSTVDLMISLGASTDGIRAAIGPTLAQPSYEVTEEFIGAFLKDTATNDKYFSPGKDHQHWQFNLPCFVEDELKKSGLSNIWNAHEDTYTDSGHYYSYRRATHAGEEDYGRLISAIMLHGGP
ncbi:peptidoglycan editing factor PgeF [Temperatibacter marinus]|uniref:Purine nucleoside phosphorylase n=1 Tax=Temperatibacter marinus TaxID=1456591 RepID=A0AA52EBA5_9PROT|nr:peptidoglycan editing factor PgeF [Temperatibacter marinus]WND01666.1 peptidoglycan editing factor PgeF [Temperatibacter marinus]